MLKSQNMGEFEDRALPLMNLLYGTARRALGNATEAEDVVQETYLQAWKSFHRFQPGTDLRAWMFKILFHVIQHHRRKSWRLVTAGENETGLFETIAYEPPAAQELRDDDFIAALENVPQYFRSVILLADVHEYSYKEVSQALGIPLGTVMSRLSRGRQMLRPHLARFSSTAAPDNRASLAV
jgi:RNA polymerase sigma-70 factor (ECF subfamily)